jgi:OPT family oligopeptide transporter
MKVPPRTLFFGQAIASLWACFVQVAVMYWAFGNIPGICEDNQPGRFTCPNGRVFFNASIIWGVIGPQRIFSSAGVYGKLQYFWILGALLPIVLYVLAKKFPKGSMKYLHAPVIFGGTAYIPPATPMIYLSWGFVSFLPSLYSSQLLTITPDRLHLPKVHSQPTQRVVEHIQLCHLGSSGCWSSSLHAPHLLRSPSAPSEPSKLVGK